jgi:hypothetical protein
LNNAIQDAANLVRAIKSVVLGGEDLGNTITAYEKEMIERGGAEVNLSLTQTLLSLNPDRFADSPVMKGCGLNQHVPSSVK